MKAHRTDTLSLAFGLIFLAIVAWWLAAQVVDLFLPNAGWLVAGTLILLGLLGLIGALRGPNRGPRTRPTAGTSETGAPETAAPETAAPEARAFDAQSPDATSDRR